MFTCSIPASLFEPHAVAPEDHSLAETLTQFTRTAPHWTELGPVAAREARALGRGMFPAPKKSERAEWRQIDTDGGPIRIRLIPPAGLSRGVYLHLHGGGWVLGDADQQDMMLQELADATGLACASVAYRLAPESPYPAAIDDCVAAARHIAAAPLEFAGGSELVIGGESAGAHLAVCTLLRLRDAYGRQPFCAANLVCGFFDLALTPSARRFGENRPVLRTSDCLSFVGAFLAHSEDPHHHAVSPLRADLSNLCPALFTVGTVDALLDDSLFLWARWQAAGNKASVALFPGGMHGLTALPGALAQSARQAAHRFVSSCLR